MQIRRSGFYILQTVPRDRGTLKQLPIPEQRKLRAVLSVTEVGQLIEFIAMSHRRAFGMVVYALDLRSQALSSSLGSYSTSCRAVFGKCGITNFRRSGG